MTKHVCLVGYEGRWRWGGGRRGVAIGGLGRINLKRTECKMGA